MSESDGVMHEYRLFIERELDARGWKMADLARRAGLHRQLIWKILHDDRDTLGNMPDDATLQGIARGFSIPVDRVRTAAARSLVGYIDDGRPLVTDVRDLSTDVLIEELRRRATQLAPPIEADRTKPPL
jgi:transcriptional regulator with XRE-family HTH domain